MAGSGIKVNMTPSHPGEFIRAEIIEELGLTVSKAADNSGSPTRHAFRPTALQSGPVPRNGIED